MTWENTNKLLSRSNDWFGIKTGITDAAGPCLASSKRVYDQNKKVWRNFIVILLSSQSMDIRWEETESLLFWV